MKRYKLICDAWRSMLLPMIIAVAPGAVYGGEASANADSAYSAGRYEEAKALYQEAIEREGRSVELLYNHANASYEAGDLAAAVISYERARRIDPGNRQVNANLEFVRTKVNDANHGELKGKKGNVMPDNPSFLQSAHQWIAADHASDSWSMLAAAAFILLISMVALYFFSTNVMLRKLGFFSSIVLVFFTTAFLVFSFMSATEASRVDRAVLTAYRQALLKSPASDAEPVSVELHKGTSLTILEERIAAGSTETWCLVRLNSDNSGWVRKSDIEVI